ncbi:MAG: trypsin-like serine protease [Bdellovibrio sp.]|nr:trypsin-like serine protease [Bdellovibrio sp.]
MFANSRIILKYFLSGLLLVTAVVACQDSQNAITLNDDANGIIYGKVVPASDSASNLVVMVFAEDAHGTSLCTGTLIEKNIVLTAAHCLYEMTNVRIEPALKFSGTKQLLADKVIIHNLYNGDISKGNDIALIRVKGILPKNYVKAELPTSADAVKEDMKIKLIGYGMTNGPGDDAGTLRTAEAIVYYAGKDLMIINQENSTGICDGDSGSPALIKKNNSYVVVGVASSTSRFSTDAKQCMREGSFMKVSAHQEWLQKNLRQLK